MADETCVYHLPFLVFIFILMLSLKLLHLFAIPILLKCFRFIYSRPSADDRDKLAKLKAMTEERSTLSMTDNFARYSKLERQMKKLESELQVNSTDRSTKSFALRVSISIFLRILQTVVCLFVVLYVGRCRLDVGLDGAVALLPDWMRYEAAARPPLWAVLPMWMWGCQYVVAVVIGYCLSE